MNILLDPNLAYLLLLAGTLLGLLALVTPGTGGLEIGAFFCLLLAGYTITQLKFNLWALILLIVSVVPFIYAIRKKGREAYLALSILGLVIGSAYLFLGEKWYIPGVNPILALTASLMYAAFVWLAVRKSIQAIMTPPTHDLSALVGQVGEAKTRIHEEGSVQVAGELWSARSKSPIPAGKQVKVIARDGFILDVEADSSKK
jgi:membrane-bound serine protease (ClpP class)